MFEQLRFYLAHSFNDLRVNGRLSFFALLSIAAGVAAIVSLQTLGTMISDTLTGNLQASNRGDIQIQISAVADDSESYGAYQQALADGILYEETSPSMFGGESTTYLTQDGLNALQAWADATYPDQIEIDYNIILTDFVGQFTGSGLGTSIIKPETDFEARQLSPVMVNPEVYPFYDTVVAKSGEAMRDLMQAPTDILIDEKVAEALDAKIGDTVTISGASTEFTVRGIVTAEQEINDPFSGLFIALFGFYYMDNDAIQYFGDAPVQVQTVRLQLANSELHQEVNSAIESAFPYVSTRTIEDLAAQNEQVANSLNQLVTVMGLVSLLIGSIGIINTMQVIVRRRMLEVAVLKAIGLQGNQVTILFLTEAFLIGLIGSLIGVVMGWGLTFVLKSVAENFVAQQLAFRIAINPAVSGVTVGTLVATIFGLMPTLTASEVRPGVVLRPNDNLVPRTGRLKVMGALVIIIFALTLVTHSIVGNLTLSLQVTIGTFIAIGIIYFLLSLIIIMIGRLFPTLGIVDLKISLRQMLAGRSRAATTLLALVVGVFSLSLITLFAQSTSAMLSGMLEGIGGNALISTQLPQERTTIEAILDENPAVTAYRTTSSYSMELVEMRLPDGTVLSQADIINNIADAYRKDFEEIPFDIPEEELNIEELARDDFESLNRVDTNPINNLSLFPVAEGRALQADDVGQQVLYVQPSDSTEYAGIVNGAELVFKYASGGGMMNFGGGSNDETITFTIVGMSELQTLNMGFANSNFLTLEGAFPANRTPDGVNIIADVEEEGLGVLRREIASIPGTYILETSVFTQLIDGLLGAFTAFPSMVAALGLIVGGVVIANSVALTTMERRREIAVMKAVGLQRERVLFMLLLENGILGFIGGLVGVGIGLVGLALMLASAGIAQATPYGSALVLMLLCIIVALVAAVTTAWGASGEKPLNVLRYE